MDFNSADHRLDHLAVVSWDGRKLITHQGSLSEDDVIDLKALLTGKESVHKFTVLQTPVDVQIVFDDEALPSAATGILDFSYLLEERINSAYLLPKTGKYGSIFG
jgi:hypothetical protein